MKTRNFLAVAALTALTFTACAKAEDGDSTVADTTAVPGTDTVDVPTVVPTTDSVIRETTVETDTIRGEGRDSVR